VTGGIAPRPPRTPTLYKWLELKGKMLKFMQEFPLDGDEVAALEGDLAAVERLVQKHFDKPTPDDCTPRQIMEVASDGEGQA